MTRPRRSSPKSPELHALGEAIRQLRSQRGWTQEDLADHASLQDAARIGRIETGQVNPTYLTLLRLARAFEISVADLTAQAERIFKGDS